MVSQDFFDILYFFPTSYAKVIAVLPFLSLFFVKKVKIRIS
jgi:hypothetical protein